MEFPKIEDMFPRLLLVLILRYKRSTHSMIRRESSPKEKNLKEKKRVVTQEEKSQRSKRKT